MNERTNVEVSQKASTANGITARYMSGFGNDFETEALPCALPQGMNSPQKVNYGLCRVH